MAGASSVQAITVDPAIIINEGAILEMSATTGSTDSATNAKLRVWFEPIKNQ